MKSARRLIIACLSLLTAGAAGAQEAGQPIFRDISEESGLRRVLPFGARTRAAGDFDNDGWPDLLFAEQLAATSSYQVVLLHNDGHGRLSDHSDRLGIPPRSDASYGGGGGFVDYDNDGDLDIFLARGSFHSPGHNFLLQNSRGVFREVAEAAGLARSEPTDNALWFDYDRDGLLDLYTGNLDANGAPDLRNRLHHNNGDGSFQDVTAAAGLDVQLNPWNGGSNGGMVAADLDDDGWPDLFVAVYNATNRLFLNRAGLFEDTTTPEIADASQAFGVAPGDIDGDGRLDLFVAAGGGTGDFRSPLYLNLGGAQFLDIAASAGLDRLQSVNVAATTLVDIDNDGDLDLLTVVPPALFLNDGDGTFTDATERAGITIDDMPTSFTDIDNDGDLDGFSWQDLFQNQGNGNHWLRVELVGAASNRRGVGARLVARAGGRLLTRELVGGPGFRPREHTIHFGLADADRVNELEIRWPSGQVDRHTDIPADQRIRVFEGRTGHDAVVPSDLQVIGLPDTVVTGTVHAVTVRVHPALFGPEALVSRVAADLSAWGLDSETPLADIGDGVYGLAASIRAPAVAGMARLSVSVDQTTTVGPHWQELSRTVAVVPADDLVLYDDALPAGWTTGGTAPAIDPGAATVVHDGSASIRIDGRAGFWQAQLNAATEIGPFGYAELRLAVFPDGVVLPRGFRFVLGIAGNSADLAAQVDLERRAWQEVTIPLTDDFVKGPVTGMFITGNFAGTLYVDDIRLVTAAHGLEPTVVTETRRDGTPAASALAPSYPNPFNSTTVIPLELAHDGRAAVVVHDVTGQHVATLVSGHRRAGRYRLRWDGTDDAGRQLASGVYLVRLSTADVAQSRKVLLLR